MGMLIDFELQKRAKDFSSAPKTFAGPPRTRKQRRLMKLVFISLEFTAGTFSGNGVYAANQVFSAGSTCLHAP